MNEFKSKESQISTFSANDRYQDALEYQNLVNMAELDLDRDPSEFETFAQTKIRNLLKQFGELGLHDVSELEEMIYLLLQMGLLDLKD